MLSADASVSEIRLVLEEATDEQFFDLVDALATDERRGVQREIASQIRKREKRAKERERVLDMYREMRRLCPSGVAIGVDEVGRGPVAGPLTVAAVALPDEPVVWGIDDSKRLTPARREELASQILEVALAVGIAHIEPQEIDACGMAACLRIAMRKAIDDAGIPYDAVLIDGLPVHVDSREVTMPKGDSRVACIAAASIVAKVTRDAIMDAADEVYPGYGFSENKGYASQEHIDAITNLGITPYHRATFCKNFLNRQETLAFE